jgi:hypothetical protein
MKICNEPVIFTESQVQKICELRDAQYVCDTTLKNGADCAVFYGSQPHPDSGSRYFGLYYHPLDGKLYVCNAADVEDIEISAVQADNGDIIYSRHRHDFRRSDDSSVWIDGGRDYVRSGLYDESRWRTLVVREGKIQLKTETTNEN